MTGSRYYYCYFEDRVIVGCQEVFVHCLTETNTVLPMSSVCNRSYQCSAVVPMLHIANTLRNRKRDSDS